MQSRHHVHPAKPALPGAPPKLHCALCAVHTSAQAARLQRGRVPDILGKWCARHVNAKIFVPSTVSKNPWRSQQYLDVTLGLELLRKALCIIRVLECEHAVPDLVGAHQALPVRPRPPSKQLQTSL